MCGSLLLLAIAWWCPWLLRPQLKEEIAGLKEDDAWPAQPQDAYGLEKLVTEELLMHYMQVGLGLVLGLGLG